MLHSGEYKYADVETASADYASRFSGSLGEWLLTVQDQTIKKLLFGLSIKEMLDVGGGHGQILRVSNDLNCIPTIVGSDAHAFSRLPDNPTWKGLVADLLKLPYQNETFDLVVSIRLLSHFEVWKDLISELCRVSSCYVMVEYPPSSGVNFLYPLLYGIKKKSEGNTRQYLSFSHREIDEAFAESGFRRLNRIGQFCVPMFLHRKAKCVALSKVLEKMCKMLGLGGLIGNPVIALYERI